MATILQCPHCGNTARTNKVVPAGAKVTCSRCRQQFPFRPAQGGPGEDRAEEAIASIPLEELLADERGAAVGRAVQQASGRPPRQKATFDDRDARALPVDEDEPRVRYDSVTNSRLVDNPLALAARSSKEKLIGGKQVRFGESRSQMAVVLGVVLLGAGYGLFVGLSWLWNYIQSQSDVAKNYRERMGKAETAGSKGSSKTGKGAAPKEAATPPAALKLVKGVAGTPVKVGDWEVVVEKAELRRDERLGILPFLCIDVRVTNLGIGPQRHRSWAKAGPNTNIRSQNGMLIPLNPGTAPKEDDVRLEPKKSSVDTLVVDGGAAKWDLDVTLLLPSGSSGCEIHIASGFIIRPE